MRRGYDGIVVAAPVTVPYERYSVHGAHHWLGRALHGLLQAAHLTSQDLDGLCVSSFTLGSDTAVGLTQHFGLSPRWLDHIPMGGACGIVALRRAARAVQAGDADIVACVAGDTNAPDSFRATVAGFSRFTIDAALPYGAGGPNAAFALLTDAYMRATGARREDFGRIAVSQRANASGFPHALLRAPLSLDQYLSARMVADPLALFDCVMPCAGAEGVLVMQEATAKNLGLAYVHLRSAIERHNAFPDDPIQLRGGWAMDRDDLYAMAATSPDQIGLLQTYDDYPVIVMLQLEGLGFCGQGEAPDFVRAHDLRTTGDFPHNSSGGQLSGGQAGAAGGYLGLTDAVRQLTGAALGPQIPGLQRALVSGFGMINYDRGLCSGAVILEAA